MWAVELPAPGVDPTQRPLADPYPQHPRRGLEAPHPPQVLSQGVASGEWDSHLHTGVTEDHSATLPFQAQVRRPDPTIWWPEGQWNTMTVPTEVPLPRRTWRVPLGGGCTRVHTPREEKRRDGVRTMLAEAPLATGHSGELSRPRLPRVAAIRPVATDKGRAGPTVSELWRLQGPRC